MNQAQQIPAGWKMVQISDICKILSGSTPKTSESEYWDGSIPWFTPLDLSKIRSRYVKASDRKITEEGFNSCSTQKIPPRSLIMSSRAPIGYFAINLEEATTNQGCKSFICSEVINVDFLYYYLSQNIDQIKRLGSGSTFAEVNKKQLESLQVIIPSKSEQTKIAAILSKVDEEIEKTERIIEQTEKLKKGLVKTLFQNQTNSAKCKISDIAEVTSSKRVMVSDYVEEGIPFYRSTEIIKKSKNIPVNSPLCISLEKFNFFKQRFGAPEKGDLLITAVGTIGDVYLVQNETFYFKDGNSVWIRKLKNFVLPEYLKMLLASSFYRDILNNIAGGSSQKALTIQKLQNVEIPTPSIPEQKRLIEILSSVDKKLLINQKIRSYLLKLKKGLMNDLLSGKVRIKT